MFKCSSGPPVETLDLWKSAELTLLLNEVPSGSTCVGTAEFMIENAERFVAILWLKEKGRPSGAKDKVKRKTRTAETTAQNAA